MCLEINCKDDNDLVRIALGENVNTTRNKNKIMKIPGLGSNYEATFASLIRRFYYLILFSTLQSRINRYLQLLSAVIVGNVYSELTYSNYKSKKKTELSELFKNYVYGCFFGIKVTFACECFVQFMSES